MKRAGGILLHITSLPSPYGVGTMGEAAYRFIDFLRKAGQQYWQILPTGPTGYGDSPYQSYSTFAGNPYFLDLDLLKEAGVLTAAEVQEQEHRYHHPEQVDFHWLYETRFALFRKGYDRCKRDYRERLTAFAADQGWVKDYGLYMALKQKFGGGSWQDWPNELRTRKKSALQAAEQELADEIGYWVFLQYLFEEQWQTLRRYANESGVRLIGDIPIYVAADSADVWANQKVFQLDREGRPKKIAGCPPDGFSPTGQLWGNPVYDWAYLEKQDYRWWLDRLAVCGSRYDVVRIDHFRGFASYYAVPYGEETAENGEWLEGPGMKLFSKVKETLPQMDIIAEDLGFLTPEVYQLLEDSGYPGMKILEFAFDSSEQSDYLPHNYPRKAVVYPGTHDNDTAAGWCETANYHDKQFACEYFGCAPKDLPWGFVRAALLSVADLAIVQMQDYLGLPSSARMNTPATFGNNWVWRMREGALTSELIDKIARLTWMTGRWPSE